MRDKLKEVRDWANEKLATGEEPPWAWFQYMKLRETLDQILAGMDATVATGKVKPALQVVGEDEAKGPAKPIPVTLPM